MSKVLQYKGYVGSIEFSEEDALLYGKVLGIRSLISYQGTDAKSLVADFHGAIDDYLSLCKEEGCAPETAYKGTLNVRLGESAHRRAAIYSANAGVSLNSFITQAVEEKLSKVEETEQS